LKYCILEEGKVLSLQEALRSCNGVSGEELVKALKDLEDCVHLFKQRFYEESRKMFGFGIKLEAPAPKIRGEVLFTGFWSGVYAYTLYRGREAIHIVIEPRVKRFYEMLRDIHETLYSYRDFQLLIQIAPNMHPSLLAIDIIRRLLYEIHNLIDREPKYVATHSVEDVGEHIGVNVEARGVELKPYTIRKALNESLAFVIAVALKSTAKAIQSLKSISSEVKGFAGSESSVMKVVEEYISQLNTFLQRLLSDEFAAYSLYILDLIDFESIDTEKYQHIFKAVKTVTSVAHGAREAYGSARIFLLPTTKIYELYVYTNIVKQLRGRVREVAGSRLALVVDTSRLYFNHYPKKLSRFIQHLTKRVPAPDILYKSQRVVAPVECKYRYLNDQKLFLSDAERLLSYVVDASRDRDLVAVVAALSRPVESEVKASVNGKDVRVVFAEVNPDTRVEDIATILRA